MKKESNHLIVGFVLVFLALCAICGAWAALSDNAHAADGDNLSPTTRDQQRLNACTNASIRPDIPGKDQVKEAIKCAALGKAVSHIESDKGESWYAKTRNNHYGIRRWDKSGRPHIKNYKTTAEADADFARIYFKFYRNVSNRTFAQRWTGEPHIVSAYAAFLNKYVPQYLKLYTSLTK